MLLLWSLTRRVSIDHPSFFFQITAVLSEREAQNCGPILLVTFDEGASHSLWEGQVSTGWLGGWSHFCFFTHNVHSWELTRNANMEDLEDDFSLIYKPTSVHGNLRVPSQCHGFPQEIYKAVFGGSFTIIVLQKNPQIRPYFISKWLITMVSVRPLSMGQRGTPSKWPLYGL